MILFLLLIASVSCNSENFRVIVKVDEKPVNEDIVLDLEKNTLLVNVGDVSHLGPKWKSTINLHDFNMQKLALKKVETGICYVTHMTEKIVELSDRLHNMTSQIFATNLTKHVYRLTKTHMTKENLIAYAGSKIADFCSGYQSIYAHRLEKNKRSAQFEEFNAKEQNVCGCSTHWFQE